MPQARKQKSEQAARRYDKGERRFKHVGRGPEAEIEFDTGNPRKWIGKCPSTLSAADHIELVNEALPASNGDRELSFPKKIYAVHEGVIYEAQTTDRGWSYHGYPYRGKLSQAMIGDLRAMAIGKKCEARFDAWLKDHIVKHGA